MRVVQKILSLPQIFDLLNSFYICMGLTCKEIKKKLN